jgi:hypothetical protein
MIRKIDLKYYFMYAQPWEVPEESDENLRKSLINQGGAAGVFSMQAICDTRRNEDNLERISYIGVPVSQSPQMPVGRSFPAGAKSIGSTKEDKQVYILYCVQLGTNDFMRPN